MNDKPLGEPSLAQQAETALKEAVKKVVEEARRTGGTLVVWKDGAVARIPADQLPDSGEPEKGDRIGSSQAVALGVGAMTAFERITFDPAVLNGQPCIRRTRLTVRRVLEALAAYPDCAEFRAEYPEIEDEDIRQALEYAAANLEDRGVELRPVP